MIAPVFKYGRDVLVNASAIFLFSEVFTAWDEIGESAFYMHEGPKSSNSS